MKLTTVGQPAANDQIRFNRASSFGAWHRNGGEQQEAIELNYALDFAPDEVVTSAGDPFRPLHFWRGAKDKFMRLLGYRHQTQWQDPTNCLPHTYSRYVRMLPLRPHALPDTTNRPGPVARLPTWPASLQLPPRASAGPPALPPAPLARRYTPLTPSGPPPARTPVPLNNPVPQNVEFIKRTNTFLNPAQAALALAGVLRVLRSFPLLRITVVGNAASNGPLKGMVYGRSPRALAYLDSYYRQGSYTTPGQLMDARAQAVRQYFVQQGISPARITCQRGELYNQSSKRRVTIIFSN